MHWGKQKAAGTIRDDAVFPRAELILWDMHLLISKINHGCLNIGRMYPGGGGGRIFY
jgi:hypothetical protein